MGCVVRIRLRITQYGEIMNLDDLNYFKSIDTQNFLNDIDTLPDQVESACGLGQSLSLPEAYRAVTHAVVTGMGGSASGGALAQALVAPECALPITLVRDYALPAFVGSKTLVIGSSPPGKHEETVEAAQRAVRV